MDNQIKKAFPTIWSSGTNPQNRESRELCRLSLIMKIILLGYGKMGKIIEGIAVNRGHQIAARIDIDNVADFEFAHGDVAIEFSHPEAAFENVKKMY